MMSRICLVINDITDEELEALRVDFNLNNVDDGIDLRDVYRKLRAEIERNQLLLRIKNV